ncbi:MAG TPA: tRNA (5-methylaminomethyl-2-thiouridine)(34)-methyltransferase MnmD [Balneolales bacterium]|nr:tRNA (5-methylaminomethyl-2-thiouridine)(34)-methyltransferase MnmD [Balneolales bacterium]
MHETTIEICRDGSDTLYSNRFKEHYHNHNGAVTESRYVFIEKTKLADHLVHNPETHVLEIGFGTGLNFALLSDLVLQMKDSGKLIYHSVEGFPIDEETAEKLNYGRFLEHPDIVEWLPGIFQNLKPGENTFTPSDKLDLHVFYGFFDDFIIPDSFADFIFFDAFSPHANPELWTGQVFQKLKSGSKPDVILSTYCAASSARAAMAWAGWFIARVPGTLGKREMTLASLNPDLLQPYRRVNEKRLAERYELGEFEEV